MRGEGREKEKRKSQAPQSSSCKHFEEVNGLAFQVVIMFIHIYLLHNSCISETN